MRYWIYRIAFESIIFPCTCSVELLTPVSWSGAPGEFPHRKLPIIIEAYKLAVFDHWYHARKTYTENSVFLKTRLSFRLSRKTNLFSINLSFLTDLSQKTKLFIGYRPCSLVILFAVD